MCRLLTRTVTPMVPARVDYELTVLGWILLPLIVALKHWAEERIGEIHATRRA
ncbi:hypothetical protein GCM10010430_38340 [Kitasatospora cystarginea]|uniref:HTH hxlR-type domain-containing protein n=1 Tax=Kitasatospora cystarginea TaxID=58350 RepID=A0ABP5R8T6_9ACTN